MFISRGQSPSTELRPIGSEISANDWSILADYWYVVAIARDLGDAPLSAQLLDVPLAVYRAGQGEIAVALDICPHRHIRLSTGRIVDGQLECPFHGLRFDASGQCVHVPALGREARLPQSYRVRTFPVKERYGFIWTCIGNPDAHELPDFPSLNAADPAAFAYTQPVIWPVSSPRQVENFVDLAHLPFVHAATIGGDRNAPLKAGRIEHGPGEIRSRAHLVETGPDGGPMPCDLTYRIVLPFAVEFKTQAVHNPDYFMESCDIPTPVSAHRCKVFQIIKHPKGREGAEAMVGPLTAINNEDIVMLNGLMQPDLPLDQRHEIHLPVDNISNAYRSRLCELGLGADDTAIAA